MKRVTIYEVAKEAGVSLATVSRVINGSDVVKGPTKTRVEEAIKKLGYKPNAIAQGLALQRTTTIGLIIPEATIRHAGPLINGLCDVAKIYEYNVTLHTISEGITNINEAIDEVIKSRVDGVIIFCDQPIDEATKTLDEYNIPMVVIGDKTSSDSVCSIRVDYESAIYNLVKDYLNRGIKNIAVVEDRKNRVISNEMLSGTQKAFKKNKLEFDNYVEYSSDERSTYKFMKTYLKTHKHDLIIVNRDSQAFAVSNAAKELDINIPEDTELVCLTDSKYNDMIRPEISSFEIPTYDLGALSMRLMTKMIKGEETESKEKVLGAFYIKRNTTK